MFDFLKNLFSKVTGLGSGYNFSTDEFVIEFLLSLINREDLIKSQIEAYKQAKHRRGEDKAEAYVHVYLELESFIVHNKPLVVKEEFADKQALREKIRAQYPTQDLHPQFKLIFLPSIEQYAHIFAIGFNKLLDYVQQSFGITHTKTIVNDLTKGAGIAAWVNTNGRIDPSLTHDVYQNYDGPVLINTFKRLYRELHKTISNDLGLQNADNAYQKTSDYIKSIYDYDIMVLFLEMVPEHIAAKERLTYLSRTELEDRVLKATAEEKSKRSLAEELSHELTIAKARVEEQVRERTKELREEQARMLASLESLQLGFVIFDVQGQIFNSNHAMSYILEHDVKTINDIQAILTSNKNLRSMFDQCVHDRKQLNVSEIPFGKKFLRVLFSPVIVSKTNETIGATMVIEDITKEIEIDHAKSDFVMLASHQLRTPLTMIKWNAELLKKALGDKVDDKAMKYFTTLEEGSMRMMALIKALLNVSRIETGKLALTPKEMDIVELSHSIITELKKDISDKSLDFIEQYENKIPKILSDPDVIRMVIENLVTNAIKYTPEKGKITIAVSTDVSAVPKDKKPDGPALILSVIDTGLGIPKDQQDKIYTKLFRAKNVELTKTSGTGLGLYIAKGAIEVCGGHIWFESEENKGTKFYVTIPVKGTVKKEGIGFMPNQPSENLLYS